MISKKQYNDIQEREKQKKIEQLEKYITIDLNYSIQED
jgi:hypothetical protein